MKSEIYMNQMEDLFGKVKNAFTKFLHDNGGSIDLFPKDSEERFCEELIVDGYNGPCSTFRIEVQSLYESNGEIYVNGYAVQGGDFIEGLCLMNEDLVHAFNAAEEVFDLTEFDFDLFEQRTIWVRMPFSVTARTEAEALEKIKPLVEGKDLKDIGIDDYETEHLYENQESLEPKDMGGLSTRELRFRRCTEIIYQNGKPALAADAPEKENIVSISDCEVVTDIEENEMIAEMVRRAEA